jgi:hypothetical protein
MREKINSWNENQWCLKLLVFVQRVAGHGAEVGWSVFEWEIFKRKN